MWGISSPKPPDRRTRRGATERGGANFWRMPLRTVPLFSTTDERLQKSAIAYMTKQQINASNLAENKLSLPKLSQDH